MKKLITVLLALTVVLLPMSAQQLPNNGFEEWEDCYPWSSTTNNGSKTQKIGTTPKGWTVANVYAGTGFLASGNVPVSEMVEGYTSGEYAVKVFVKHVNAVIVQKYIPGYFSLGTTWSTAVAIKAMDGGTFGGLDFNYQPDAVTFKYKASTKACSVVAYMWKGQYVQKDVPANIVMSGSPETVDMIDRDRQILKEVYPELYVTSERQGGAFTQNGTLVAYNKARPAIAADWTSYTLPLIYKDGAGAPEKFNVIFSQGDYFTNPEAADKDNTMTVDDVKLLYYSRLKSIAIADAEVSLVDGTYDYDLSETVYMPASEDAFVYTLLGEAPTKTVEVALDAENLKATVTVKNTNEGATDVDGKAEHVYTFTFKAPRVFSGVKYGGNITKLTMAMPGEEPGDLITEPTAADVYLTQKGTKRIVDMLLPDFTLPGMGVIGDILVPDVKRVYSNVDGQPIYNYSGHVDDLSLLEGGIHAIVDLEGTSDEEGNVAFQIHVKWVMDYEAPEAVKGYRANSQFAPIEVEFNGKTDTPEVPTGISDVVVDDEYAPVEYFNMQGMRVARPEAGSTVIRRQGTKVEKIIIR